MLWLVLSCTNLEDKEPERPVSLIDYVDPFAATGGVGYGVNCGYPGATMPLGMVKLSPDSATATGAADGFYRGGGYHYDDETIQGFSHMHLYATGLTDYGTLAVMPSDGISADKITRRGYGLPFSHDKESASPGHYRVDLDVAEVELSASLHTGLHEYRFAPAVQEPTVLLDVGHSMGRGVVPEGEISISASGQEFWGHLVMDGEMSKPFPIYFYGRFENVPDAFGIWAEDELYPGQISGASATGDISLGAWFSFEPDSTTRLRVALSNVDAEGARSNFSFEHTDYSISAQVEQARQAWKDKLDAIEVWGGSTSERSIFATALYHTLQMPTLFSDVDGRYRGFDGEIHTSSRLFYSDFSLWDTYRTVHPLYTLVWPELHSDLLWSLSRMAQEGGGLPRWPLANRDSQVMLGSSVNIVFAEAWLKGIRNFEEDALYQIARDAMMQERELNFGATPDLALYEELGYWPADTVGRSVAWTQEQSLADHALGLLAMEQGDTTTGTHLLERGHNWQNLWNPENGWIHGRNADGAFTTLSSESEWIEDYAEGNARQYLWLVPHEPESLFSLMGDNALVRLEQMFDEMEAVDGELPGLPESWYWHGNEPGLHIPWLFFVMGERELGNQWIAWLMENRYAAAPTALAGNDDGGTLSAWYIFASMGVYPMAGTTRYVVGQSIWDRVEIPATGISIGKDGSDSSVWVDGEEWDNGYLNHGSFQTLRFGNAE